MSSSQASTLVNRGGKGGATAGPPPGASGGAKRRPAGGAKPSSRMTVSDKTAGMFSLRMYNEDAPGLKVGPTAVLVTSLVYIGIVILLHIYGRLRGE
mmetsp:Transcript_17544/g.36425  ORF Transcript_17544/g.36425 Transcript_17544/m.36425 type:complete len:97 (+) Transcript_17544:74-364(+)|eukprot:CAMPEP_0184680666 /NCGR_PEP_ID=MMETSP0312-20130426/3566_1 /TAXON_ID=31354 /ORGANISM="Compsopogon coeruleus, Strain SAG 36.94" /LENGTH=96 /DNA_ID=CAMNT_0027130941 /DNA_START=27 /DNA_END=317 /DNA_ORIENTATION=+